MSAFLRFATSLIAVICLTATPAHSAVHVLLLQADNEPVTPAFVDALRIHLGQDMLLKTGPALKEQSLFAQFARASTIVGKDKVALVLWMRRVPVADNDRIDTVVYAVGQQQERALVVVARVPRIPGPDHYRDIALNVGKLLNVAVAVSRRTPNVAAPLAVTDARAARAGPALLAELGTAGALGAGSVGWRVGVQGALGATFPLGRLRVATYLVHRRFSGIRAETSLGDLQISDSQVLAGARLLARWGSWRAGGTLEAGGRLLVAHGHDSARVTDGIFRAVPLLRGGLDGRLSLSRHVELRLLAGIEVSTVHQRFTIRGTPAVDMGSWRPVGELSLIILAP